MTLSVESARPHTVDLSTTRSILDHCYDQPDPLFERRPETSQALSPPRRSLAPRSFHELVGRTRATKSGLEELGRPTGLD